MTRLRSYWSGLGDRLWVSQPGRMLFTGALLLAGVAAVDAVGRGVVGVAPLDDESREYVVVARR